MDLSHVSTAVFVVGAAATGASVLLLPLAPPRGKAKEPAATVGVGGMTLDGAF